METATLAGGCFWCTEAVFQRLKGVRNVVSGYTGGHVPDPSYEQVTTGRTGHAEAIRFEFDPAMIPYEMLLEVFFATHDPTTPNQQGYDVGPQYRSAIFVHTPEQEATARAVIGRLEREGRFPAPIVTEVVTAGPFYPAEAYHQDYYNRHRSAPYCQVIIDPKVQKLMEEFGALTAA